jgi:hypothetical protein
MTRICEVHRRGTVILVTAMSRTVDGFWVVTPPHRRLDASSSAGEVGEAVAEALAGSQDGVPNPPVRGGPLPIQPLLDLAGVKSWSTFVKGTVLARVEQERRSITITPLRNLGARDGFAELDDPLTLRPGDTVELGSQVLAALDKAA